MKLRRERLEDLTRWSWRWFSVRAVILLPLVLFLASVAVAGLVGMISGLLDWNLERAGLGAFFAGAFEVVGWSLGRGVPAELVNRTEVTFDGRRVVVRHWPSDTSLRAELTAGEVSLEGVEVVEVDSRFWEGGDEAGWVFRLVGRGPGVEVVIIDGLLEGDLANELARELTAELVGLAHHDPASKPR